MSIGNSPPSGRSRARGPRPGSRCGAPPSPGRRGRRRGRRARSGRGRGRRGSRGGAGGEREPKLRVRLVDGAEGFDARVGLGDAAEVAQRRLPASPSRVDPRQPYRLVPSRRPVGYGRNPTRRSRARKGDRGAVRRSFGTLTSLRRCRCRRGSRLLPRRRGGPRGLGLGGGRLGPASPRSRTKQTHLYVDPDAHGRGIGGALMGTGEEAPPRWIPALGLPAERERAPVLRAPRLRPRPRDGRQ